MKELEIFQDVLWVTDIHANMLLPDVFHKFLDELAERKPKAILIGGDIAVAWDITAVLSSFAKSLTCPVFFVLGNHDFYGGNIQTVRSQVLGLDHSNLTYLSASGVNVLMENVALIGHDGWSDGRYGKFETSPVALNDYLKIQDLHHIDIGTREWVDRPGLLKKLNALGDEAGTHIRKNLREAVQHYPTTLLLTHVPPFQEASWHEGRISDDQWAPHFTCKAVGDAIMEVMVEHPHRQLITLCGHTHSPGITQPLPNVKVYTGHAIYGITQIQNDLDWETFE